MSETKTEKFGSKESPLSVEERRSPEIKEEQKEKTMDKSVEEIQEEKFQKLVTFAEKGGISPEKAMQKIQHELLLTQISGFNSSFEREEVS